MTYEEAARTLSRYYKHNFGPTVPPSNPPLKTSLEMAIDLLFKRAAQEKAVSYVQVTTAGSINDISNQGENGDIIKYTNDEDKVGEESND